MFQQPRQNETELDAAEADIESEALGSVIERPGSRISELSSAQMTSTDEATETNLFDDEMSDSNNYPHALHGIQAGLFYAASS